jgi:hypothetical protein
MFRCLWQQSRLRGQERVSQRSSTDLHRIITIIVHKPRTQHHRRALVSRISFLQKCGGRLVVRSREPPAGKQREIVSAHPRRRVTLPCFPSRPPRNHPRWQSAALAFFFAFTLHLHNASTAALLITCAAPHACFQPDSIRTNRSRDSC